jgi:hypothetical protein
VVIGVGELLGIIPIDSDGQNIALISLSKFWPTEGLIEKTAKERLQNRNFLWHKKQKLTSSPNSDPPNP